MKTPGEDLTFRLVAESPDSCSRDCPELGEFLFTLISQINSGEVNPNTAIDPFIAMVNACPRAVQLGALNQGVAIEAAHDLNATLPQTPPDGQGEEAPCIFHTHLSWHAIMYAEGRDPYDGWLDFEDLDEPGAIIWPPSPDEN